MNKINWNKAEFKTSYGTSKQIPPSEHFEVVFSGRSNVGKSSLINKLLNRKSLARVSGSPGKTATINFYSVDFIQFVDLPGYGYAKTVKTEKRRWAELVEGYFNIRNELGLVLQLIDFRHPPTDDDISMINFLTEKNIPFAIILTKADKLKKKERLERLKNINSKFSPLALKIVEFSALTGEGVDDIHEFINEAVKD